MLTACSTDSAQQIARHPRTTILVWALFTLLAFAVTLGGRGRPDAVRPPHHRCARRPGLRQRRSPQDILTDQSTTGPSLTLAVSGRRPDRPRGARGGRPRPCRPERDRRRRVGDRPLRRARRAREPGRRRPAGQGRRTASSWWSSSSTVSPPTSRTPPSPTSSRASSSCPAPLRRASAPRSPARSGAPPSSSRRSPVRWRRTCRPARRSRCRSPCSSWSWCSAGCCRAGDAARRRDRVDRRRAGIVLVLSHWLEMDASVVNVVTVLGLGLSIDYGLLIVSRFREELHALVDEDDGTRGPAPPRRRRRADGAAPHHAHRRPHRDVLRADRRDLDRRAARLPALDPAGVRQRRRRGDPRRDRHGDDAGAGPPRARRPATGQAGPGRPGPRAAVAHPPAPATCTSEEGAFSRLAGRVQRQPVAGDARARSACSACSPSPVAAPPAAQLDLRAAAARTPTQRAYLETIADQYPASQSASGWVVAEGSLDEVTTWSAQVADAARRSPPIDPPAALGPYVVIRYRVDTTDPGGAEAMDAVRAVRALDAPFPTWVDRAGRQPARLPRRAQGPGVVGRRDRRRWPPSCCCSS